MSVSRLATGAGLGLWSAVRQSGIARLASVDQRARQVSADHRRLPRRGSGHGRSQEGSLQPQSIDEFLARIG